MAVIDTLKTYEALRKNLEEKQAKAVAEVLEASFESYRENQKEFLVTKEEFYKEIANLRAELIKWMFIFWAGQIFALAGILFAFFKR